MIIFSEILNIFDIPIEINRNKLFMIGDDVVIQSELHKCDRCIIKFHDDSFSICRSHSLWSCKKVIEEELNGIYKSYSGMLILVRKMTLYDSIYLKYMDLNKLERCYEYI